VDDALRRPLGVNRDQAAPSLLIGLLPAVVYALIAAVWEKTSITVKRTRLVLLVLLLLAAPGAVQAQFTYTTNSDGVTLTITGYTGSGGAVTIPANIDDQTVTAIGDYAFMKATPDHGP